MMLGDNAENPSLSRAMEITGWRGICFDVVYDSGGICDLEPLKGLDESIRTRVIEEFKKVRKIWDERRIFYSIPGFWNDLAQ